MNSNKILDGECASGVKWWGSHEQLQGLEYERVMAFPALNYHEVASGGALYIMFENHVHSWPFLKTP